MKFRDTKGRFVSIKKRIKVTAMIFAGVHMLIGIAFTSHIMGIQDFSGVFQIAQADTYTNDHMSFEEWMLQEIDHVMEMDHFKEYINSEARDVIMMKIASGLSEEKVNAIRSAAKER